MENIGIAEYSRQKAAIHWVVSALIISPNSTINIPSGNRGNFHIISRYQNNASQEQLTLLTLLLIESLEEYHYVHILNQRPITTNPLRLLLTFPLQ